MPDATSIPIADQLECVAREIVMRERLYPSLVASGRMSPNKARSELETMRAVLETLRRVELSARPRQVGMPL